MDMSTCPPILWATARDASTERTHTALAATAANHDRHAESPVPRPASSGRIRQPSKDAEGGPGSPHRTQVLHVESRTSSRRCLTRPRCVGVVSPPSRVRLGKLGQRRIHSAHLCWCRKPMSIPRVRRKRVSHRTPCPCHGTEHTHAGRTMRRRCDSSSEASVRCSSTKACSSAICASSCARDTQVPVGDSVGQRGQPCVADHPSTRTAISNARVRDRHRRGGLAAPPTLAPALAGTRSALRVWPPRPTQRHSAMSSSAIGRNVPRHGPRRRRRGTGISIT